MNRRTIIINASAGSGKTYRLAVAYLQALLRPGPDGAPTLPQQVLATTFTKSAAAEILERVLRRLALAVISEEKRRALLADLDAGPGVDRAGLAVLLTSVCQSLPMLQIGTIDALFARMARVMGLDLAFPPAWTVADDTQAAELALEAADRMLRGPEAATTLGAWRRYAQFRPILRVRAALADLLEERRFLLVPAETAADDPALAPPRRLDSVEAQRLIAVLEKFDVPRTKGKRPEPSKRWVKVIAGLVNSLRGEPTLVSLLGAGSFLWRVHVPGGSYYSEPVPEKLREILRPLLDDAQADLRRLYESRLPALAAMARRYHEWRRQTAYAAAAYRFAEIESAARALPPHLTPDDLYFRLDGRVQHLLLDEFQDTSVGQFQFLWPIIGEIRANERLFFVVGDAKQSIYGWRGANRRLLNQLPGWLETAPEKLDTNYRSSPAVLRAINRLYERLGQLPCFEPERYEDDGAREKARVCREAAAAFQADFRAHTAGGANARRTGCVRLRVTPEDGDEIAEILDAVTTHRREDPAREIAVLCRRRKWIPAIIAGLRRLGIEASGEGGSAVADSAAVELVLSMLTWIDHPGHTLAREHVARSAVGGIFGLGGESPDPFLPKRVLTEIMRTGLAPIVAGWVRDESFRRLATAHDQARCEQLVEMARHWDAAGGGRLSGFVERARSQRLENPVSARVRVMTIHGAKGLEFDAVVVADLQGRSGGASGPEFVVTMESPESSPRIELLPKAAEADWLDLGHLRERATRDDFEEDLSILYVALTRAKSFLDVVIAATEKLSPSLAAVLTGGWGQIEPGTHVIETEEPPAADGDTAGTPDDAAIVGRDAGMADPAGAGWRLARFKPAPERLAAITPSGQEGAGVVKLGQVLNIGNSLALEWGTAVHALVSRIEWNDRLPAPEAWAGAIPAREAEPEACRRAARELHPRLLAANDALGAVFDEARWRDRWRGDGVTRLEVWRERRFAVVLGAELMNGSFDRVVLGLNASGAPVRAAILDFKTDRVTDDAQRAERQAFYQPQLAAYAQALHLLTRLPAAAITTELVWVHAALD